MPENTLPQCYSELPDSQGAAARHYREQIYEFTLAKKQLTS
jgi:hypothetical protein